MCKVYQSRSSAALCGTFSKDNDDRSKKKRKMNKESVCYFFLLPEYQYGGSTRKLYQERNDLLHDLAVVRQIGTLYSTLKVGAGLKEVEMGKKLLLK